MRHLTLEYIAKLVEEAPKLKQDRAPLPMPGKLWPTRVAWHYEVASSKRVVTNPQTGAAVVRYGGRRTLSYIGKPNRYRALQAFRLMALCSQGRLFMLSSWKAAFDRGGLLAYENSKGQKASCPAYFAYHPHSSQVEFANAFTKPVSLKYIGGMRLYSLKKKLSQEAVDAYYEWYFKMFKRKLRRPKSQPTAIVGGEVVQDTEQ